MKIYNTFEEKTMDLAEDIVYLYSDFDWYDFADTYGVVDGSDFSGAITDMYAMLVNDTSTIISDLDDIIEELEYDLESYEDDPDTESMLDRAIQLRKRVESL